MIGGARLQGKIHDVDIRVMKRAEPRADRLDTATLLVEGLLLFCTAVLLLLVLDSGLRTPAGLGKTEGLFRALGLSIPVLIPSGSEGRNPDGIDRRVDSRFSPFFPLPDPDAAGLIIRGKVQDGWDGGALGAWKTEDGLPDRRAVNGACR